MFKNTWFKSLSGIKKVAKRLMYTIGGSLHLLDGVALAIFLIFILVVIGLSEIGI